MNTSLQNNCGDIITQLQEKLKTTTDLAKLGPTNYGLFVPTEPGSKSGVWLDLESTIERYAKENIIKSGVRKYERASVTPLHLSCSGHG